jgi:4-amino-4-deoxy-L-arabinose transferase-like glycosyltransferase
MSRPSGLDAAPSRLAGLRYAGAVALTKWAASAIVLATGFRAVSDDDFSRVVIAEQWARAPRWDASGTSWLPFPFWITGAAMMALGRSLSTARGTALVLGLCAAVVVYEAARWLGEERAPAAAGAIVAAIFPWSARLGVATVPELPTAALTLLGMAALGGAAEGRARETRLLWGGAALAAAALSRYEAWPVALLFGAAAAVEAARRRSGRTAAAALLALAGPASWVLWNRLAHGDALHFLARVAAYKQALGGPEPGAGARLAAYPVAMLAEEPEVSAVLVTAIALIAARGGRRAARAALGRYAWPAALAAAQIAALSLAMIKDGAPTHHPERAVLAALLLAAVAAGALSWRAVRLGAWRITVLVGAAALAAVVVRHTARETFAARGDEEAAGRAAAGLARPGEKVLVEVRDYGYLAVLAALGRPEDAVPDRSIDPRDPPQASSFGDVEALRARVLTADARWVVARRDTPAQVALGAQAAWAGAWGVFPAQGGAR